MYNVVHGRRAISYCETCASLSKLALSISYPAFFHVLKWRKSYEQLTLPLLWYLLWPADNENKKYCHQAQYQIAWYCAVKRKIKEITLLSEIKIENCIEIRLKLVFWSWFYNFCSLASIRWRVGALDDRWLVSVLLWRLVEAQVSAFWTRGVVVMADLATRGAWILCFSVQSRPGIDDVDGAIGNTQATFLTARHNWN
jgi:hypothetical protein